jgi:phosphoribosylformimino-5-aminoimidazole carboxamide ribotide isomerase
MILYPAIDILDGEVVRLVEGDFAQKTVFSLDPRELLARFAEDGATCAHLVDLSGARDPSRRQSALFARLVQDCRLKLQTGGGLRTLQDIEALLNLGVDRAVIGSLAVTQPDVVLQAITHCGPERLTLALDVRLTDGEAMVMSHGWAKSSGLSFAQVLMPFLERGLKRVLCTDIAVDGRPVGPNLALYRSLKETFPTLELQASGGVSRLEDLQALRETGVHSVVIGRALLSGAFTLTEALRYAR